MEEMNELTAEEQAKLLRHELEAVYGSSSYKIGRAVTWLPRHAKKALAYLAHNGPAISAKYLYTYAKYHKVANKEYAYWACLQKKDYPEALKGGSWRRTIPISRSIWSTPRPSAKRRSGSSCTAIWMSSATLWISTRFATGSGRKSARII